MRNRAKCLLCGDIIESKEFHDYVACSCKAIGICGGTEHHYVATKNPNAFLRLEEVEDAKAQGIDIQQKQGADSYHNKDASQFSRADLIYMLDKLAESIERLPMQARFAPITHADHHDLISLLSSIFKA